MTTFGPVPGCTTCETSAPHAVTRMTSADLVAHYAVSAATAPPLTPEQMTRLRAVFGNREPRARSA